MSVPSHSEPTKDWNIRPSLALGLDYSSNIDLSSKDETDSVIGRITPGVGISRQGRYLTSGVDYQLQLVDYSSSDQSNEYFHRLNAFADAELVEDRLFIDSRATASQQLIDNRSAGTADPALAADNFTNTLTFSVTPSWRQRLGDYTELSLSTSYDTVVYQSGAEDSEGVSYDLNLDTANNPNKFYWTLDLRQNEATSNNSDTTLTQEDAAEAQLGYRFSQQLDLRVGGGYVDNHIDNPTDSDVEDGRFWSAGLTWSPNPRATLDLYYSDQLQTSNSRGLTFNLRRKRSQLTLSYQQGLSSVRQQLLIPTLAGLRVCPAGDPNSPQCRSVALSSTEPVNPADVVGLEFGLLPSLTEGQFINDSINADYRYSYSKTSVTFGVFGNRRKFQDLSNEEERDLGFRAGWGLKLSGRSTLNASYHWSVLEPDANQAVTVRDYRQGGSLSLNRALSPDASIDLALRYNKHRTDEAENRFEEYGASIAFNQHF